MISSLFDDDVAPLKMFYTVYFYLYQYIWMVNNEKYEQSLV
jgi:hypothetical protein